MSELADLKEVVNAFIAYDNCFAMAYNGSEELIADGYEAQDLHDLAWRALDRYRTKYGLEK